MLFFFWKILLFINLKDIKIVFLLKMLWEFGGIEFGV